MGHLGENTVLNLKNKSYAATAEVVLPDGQANGVIVAQGGAFGGWSLYVKDGRLKSCHNVLGIRRWYTEADSALPPGKHQVRMEFAYEGGGLGKGGDVTLYVDGGKVGEGHVELTQPLSYSLDETLDIGCESGTPVAEDYTVADQRVQRDDRVGAARPGSGRPRPPDQPGRAAAGGAGAPLGRSRPGARGSRGRPGRRLADATRRQQTMRSAVKHDG